MYTILLASLAVFFLLAESIFPWRKSQPRLRRHVLSDLAYFLFNGYVLGVWVFLLMQRIVLPAFYSWSEAAGLSLKHYQGPAAAWPLWSQIVAAIVIVDFTQWSIHNLLHRSNLLWEFHKVHHSIQDEEMDFLAAFRFHWMEAIVYAALQLPVLLFFGFSGWAVLAHSMLGTAFNYVNHANLPVRFGAARYLFNSPKMHIWHHDANAERAVNFGVIFSLWDHLFGTAYMPEGAPSRLGFSGDEAFPKTIIGQNLWPAQKILSSHVEGTPMETKRASAIGLLRDR